MLYKKLGVTRILQFSQSNSELPLRWWSQGNYPVIPIYVLSPEILSTLNSVGLPKNFPHSVAASPKNLLGLGETSLYKFQLVNHIYPLMDFRRNSCITGKHQREGIDKHKLEIWCRESLFGQDCMVLKASVIKTWCTSTWVFLNELMLFL